MSFVGFPRFQMGVALFGPVPEGFGVARTQHYFSADGTRRDAPKEF